jgi:Uma2 family endonuclease
MSVSPSRRRLTIEEYLETEESSEVRREYLGGWVYAMAGASEEHNIIATNIVVSLKSHLRGGPCRVFISDMKVRVEATDAFYYPDIVVTCDPKDDQRYFKTRPAVIIEVSSPSTKFTDHREKLLAYQALDSLRQYVVIAQERVSVESFTRQGKGALVKAEVDQQGPLVLESIGLTIPFADIYEGVVFRSEPSETDDEES